MALRATLTARRDKEKLRQNQNLRLRLQGLMNKEWSILKPLASNIDEVNPKQKRSGKDWYLWHIFEI